LQENRRKKTGLPAKSEREQGGEKWKLSAVRTWDAPGEEERDARSKPPRNVEARRNSRSKGGREESNVKRDESFMQLRV